MTGASTVTHDITREFDQFVKECDSLIDRSKVRIALDVGSRDALVAIKLRSTTPMLMCSRLNVTRRRLNSVDVILQIEMGLL